MKKFLFSCLLLPLTTFANDITTCQDLQNIQKDLTAHYTLTHDIDCANFIWTPITGTFKGKIDGQNHHILNLVVDEKLPPAGLFSTLENAEIKNIVIENSGMNWHSVNKATRKNAATSVGFIAAKATNSVLMNIELNHVHVVVNDALAAGMFAGEAKDVLLSKVKINDSFLQASAQYAGLMIGSVETSAINKQSSAVNGIIHSSIESSQLYASHPLSQAAYGGLTGYSNGTLFLDNKIENLVISRAKKTTKNIHYAGAISGMTEINNNYVLLNQANAEINGVDIGGGLFGQMKISACFADRAVEQNSVYVTIHMSEMAAGLAAETISEVKNDGNCLISNNALQGYFESQANSEAISAGFIAVLSNNAHAEMTIENNYAVTSINAQNNEDMAGFIHTITKSNPAPIFIANFWDREEALVSNAMPIDAREGVKALTTAEMQTPATFVNAGWDTEHVWSVEPAQYPRLVSLAK